MIARNIIKSSLLLILASAPWYFGVINASICKEQIEIIKAALSSEQQYVMTHSLLVSDIKNSIKTANEKLDLFKQSKNHETELADSLNNNMKDINDKILKYSYKDGYFQQSNKQIQKLILKYQYVATKPNGDPYPPLNETLQKNRIQDYETTNIKFQNILHVALFSNAFNTDFSTFRSKNEILIARHAFVQQEKQNIGGLTLTRIIGITAAVSAGLLLDKTGIASKIGIPEKMKEFSSQSSSSLFPFESIYKFFSNLGMKFFAPIVVTTSMLFKDYFSRKNFEIEMNSRLKIFDEKAAKIIGY